MRSVRIISGAYGQHVGNRIVVRDIRSEPFEVDDAEADRIVSLGIAVFVEVDADSSGHTNMPDSTDDSSDDNAAHFENDSRPAYTIDTPVSELRGIAKACGITFAVGTNKAQMIKALDEYFDDTQSPSEMPSFTVGDPIG